MLRLSDICIMGWMSFFNHFDDINGHTINISIQQVTTSAQIHKHYECIIKLSFGIIYWQMFVKKLHHNQEYYQTYCSKNSLQIFDNVAYSHSHSKL